MGQSGMDSEAVPFFAMMIMMSGVLNRGILPLLNRLLRPFRLWNTALERRGNGFNGNGHRTADFTKLPLQEIEPELQRAAEKSPNALLNDLRALASASDSKDPYTRGHSERVTRFSVEIARLLGLPEDVTDRIRIGALIHDVGKIAIDASILNKPTILTDPEYAIMKTHTIRGYELLEHIPGLQESIQAAHYHHEQLNGKGYPYGLKGDEIPLIVRVITVADCFDAMTTTRIYQDPTPVEYVLGRIRSAAGIKYDEHVVEALVRGVRTGRIVARSEDSVQNKSDALQS